MISRLKINKKIKKIKDVLMEELDIIDKKTIKRVRKIRTKDIFFTLVQMIFNHLSYAEVNCKLKINQDLDVSYQAINKKILAGNYSKHFCRLNQTLIDRFFYHKNKPEKIMAVDGSKVRMNSSLNKEGFHMVPSHRYTQGLISVQMISIIRYH
jgi:hypothetical protein